MFGEHTPIRRKLIVMILVTSAAVRKSCAAYRAHASASQC
jgi:hypothetical protein